MSRNYDNWERLVAAVLKRELIWKLCHENSRTPSPRSSISSDFSSCSSSSFQFLNRTPDETFKYACCPPFQTFAKRKRGRLEIFEGSPAFSFGLEQLLMAPCIVLGDEIATFKNTYLVSLRDDVVFVVKRLRRGNAGRSLYEQNIKDIGCIEHENVSKLRGCYWCEDECFGFYDYFPQGSVCTMLHGQKGENGVDLDWESRIRIAVGAAKGLVHIHTQQNGKFSHGNIKASNIFLNPEQYGCLADIRFEVGLLSRYHAPEVSTTRVFSHESDVYSFGILLIELLSGKYPFRVKNRTFADWALHIACDEWTALVFDKGLLKDPMVKRGMWNMLAVALSCLDKKPEGRPKMNYVLEVLESIHANLDVYDLGIRRKLIEEEAETWWLNNKERVYKKYSVYSKELISRDQNATTRNEFPKNVNPKHSEVGGSGGQITGRWVEKYEPGIYVTLAVSSDGSGDVLRIRFSRRRFTKDQAEAWWPKNRQKVYEKYNVQARLAQLALSSVSPPAGERKEG